MGLVDLKGFEPLTSSMPWKRAPNCATGPRMRAYRHENITATYRKYRAPRRTKVLVNLLRKSIDSPSNQRHNQTVGINVLVFDVD
jgi:hypothetical protein